MNTLLQPQQIGQGDFGVGLPFTILDANGNPINLAGIVLTLVVQDANDPTKANLSLGGNPMAIDDAADGVCHYEVANGDFTYPGTFNAQIVVTSSGYHETFQAPNIIVTPALPKTNN